MLIKTLGLKIIGSLNYTQNSANTTHLILTVKRVYLSDYGIIGSDSDLMQLFPQQRQSLEITEYGCSTGSKPESN